VTAPPHCGDPAGPRRRSRRSRLRCSAPPPPPLPRCHWHLPLLQPEGRSHQEVIKRSSLCTEWLHCSVSRRRVWWSVSMYPLHARHSNGVLCCRVVQNHSSADLQRSKPSACIATTCRHTPKHSCELLATPTAARVPNYCGTEVGPARQPPPAPPPPSSPPSRPPPLRFSCRADLRRLASAFSLCLSSLPRRV
jgi:hypothetical protein